MSLRYKNNFVKILQNGSKNFLEKKNPLKMFPIHFLTIIFFTIDFYTMTIYNRNWD